MKLAKTATLVLFSSTLLGDTALFASAFVPAKLPQFARRTIRVPDVVSSASSTSSMVIFAASADGDKVALNHSKLPKPKQQRSARRDFLVAAAGAATAAAAVGIPAATAAAGATLTAPRSAVSNLSLLADLPMIRIRLPWGGGVGREYVALRLKINGQGPFEFMLDTGLTTEFITPHLQNTLGLRSGSSSTSSARRIRGLAAGGETKETDLIELRGASLCCGNFADGLTELPLPLLHAVITDFPQEHLDPAHDPIEGMLGMEMLSLFDVDLDFPAGRVRFYKPGTAAAAGATKGLVEIPAVVINETGLIGIRITAANSGNSNQQQPVLGFLDCGSTFSAINFSAASYMGLPTNPQDRMYKSGNAILAVGIDGRPQQLPLVTQQLSFVGDPTVRNGQLLGFAPPPASWKPWAPVPLAVGDLPAFSSILGDGVRPFTGPAALIGLDVLAQRRILLEAGDPKTRARRVFVSPQ